MRPEKSPMRKLPMELKVDILIKAIYSVEPRVIEVQFDLTTNEWSAVEESYVRSHLVRCTTFLLLSDYSSFTILIGAHDLWPEYLRPPSSTSIIPYRGA